MRNRDLLKWFAPATLGLSMLCPATALALNVIDYTPSTTFTFNLSTDNRNQDFGTVYIESASVTGWELRVRSTQGGALHHSNHLSTVSYTLTVNGIQVGSLAGGNDTTVLTGPALSCPPLMGCTLDVRATMSTDDIAKQPSGSYSDTLIFTLIDQ